MLKSVKKYGSVSSANHHSYHPIWLLKSVCSHKVLVLIIQNNLNASVSKAAKHLQILHVLRQGGIPGEDIIAVYYYLEYCCGVWHSALPFQQDRASPKASFQYNLYWSLIQREALQVFDCPRQDEWRDNFCVKP